jgi:hypothetical protein
MVYFTMMNKVNGKGRQNVISTSETRRNLKARFLALAGSEWQRRGGLGMTEV